jgi:hypothetical protein
MIPSFTTILNTAKDLESLCGKVKDKLLETAATAKGIPNATRHSLTLQP